jgi:hypothetical protein
MSIAGLGTRAATASIAVLFLLVFGSATLGHDAPSGWAYDAACCSDRDCAPLPEGSVQERADGFLLKTTGELVGRDKAKRGQDEYYHLCRSVYSKAIYCIYLPQRGS